MQPRSYKITNNVYAEGVIDTTLDLFDELMPLPDGTSYNSYLIKGSEKTALIDTCDERFAKDLIKKLKKHKVNIDYIIANHAEQDHTGAIPQILNEWPHAIIVTNEKAKHMIEQELNMNSNKFKIITNNEKLSLGDKTLEFIFAPWVHWPETMFTYLEEDKILFSCDLFGAHLANNNFAKNKKQILIPAKRYYAEIMMPFSIFVKKHLNTLKNYDIKIIAPSHGPIYNEPELILNLYNEWTSNKIEKKVVIPYVSMHGNTKNMIDVFAKELEHLNIPCKLHDVTLGDVGDVVIDCMNSHTMIMASSIYLGGLHPQAANFLYLLNGFKPTIKYSTIISSHNWGGAIIKEYREKTKSIKYEFIDPIEIEGTPNTNDEQKIKELAKRIHDLIQHEKTETKTKNKDVQKKITETNSNNNSKLEMTTSNEKIQEEKNNEEPTHDMKEEEKKQIEYHNELHEDFKFNEEMNILIVGEAGQGLETIQQVLTHLLSLEGYNVYTTKEYMSRVRGGSNSVQIRISSKPVCAPVNKTDILVPLDEKALEHAKKKITKKTIILGDKKYAETHENIINVPFEEIAKNIAGHKIYANTMSIATILGIFEGNLDTLKGYIYERFEKKGETIINNNYKAADEGYKIGQEIAKKNLHITINKEKKKNILLTGADAISMGAIAGGCNFISSYPMSPSTSVLSFMAGHMHEFKIVVEQVEDEISAINMALGASYAGARAMITTSGGGLALMSEGVSLCGMIETPLVLHIAQRPGPATGLPTRTGQEDLNLALNSGHGEFPRMIYSPGTLEDGFYLMQRAFNMAEKYQIPVFLLSDQYYVDTYYNTNIFNTDDVEIINTIIKTNEAYNRYEYKPDGISPRGIPGYGDGLVCADSDEHDETGHITESCDVRVRMQDKRLKKQETMMQDVLKPRIIGDEYNYNYAIICYGSTLNSVKEAVEKIQEKEKIKITIFHYTQLYPLHHLTEHYLMHAKKTMIVEGNATGQFAKLIASETGFKITERILKYDGLQFSVEEIKDEILKRI
ncbi:MAG: 2-oxoacid:acceptor oxidoreductase subunit alpha [Candidatus Woesearchaeota archaeon]